MSKHRIVYGITGFIILLFLGMIYAWSIYVAPLEAEFGSIPHANPDISQKQI